MCDVHVKVGQIVMLTCIMPVFLKRVQPLGPQKKRAQICCEGAMVRFVSVGVQVVFNSSHQKRTLLLI